MNDSLARLSPWITFAGCVLVVVVLYWAQAVLIPLALAILLTFVLTPLVGRVQRWLGRVPGVLTVVALAFVVLGVLAWGLAYQMSFLAADLPGYRDNIREKIADVRQAGRGGSVAKVQETLDDIRTEIEKPDARAGTAATPLVVRSEQVASLWGFPAWLSPLLSPLSTASLVIVMVIFMLLEREDLRGRLIELIGSGHLAVTTKAFDEAGQRVSRQLLMQSLVNLLYGAGVGVGLFFFHVPYPLLWAALGAVLRFIPYLGPILAAGAPIAVSLAALPGWTEPLYVVGLFVALELFTNLVLETALYAGAAGVSQVALLVAVAFWTWLWGPMGLLMATPLTVCLVVLGRHVPGLEFLSTMMADTPALAPDVSYYQRLLARDQSEAADLIERHSKTLPADTLYDALLVPALNYAERDRIEGRLSTDEEALVVDATRELMSDAATAVRAARGAAAPNAAPPDSGASAEPPRPRVHVLAYPANGMGDELALRMLDQLLEASDVTLDIAAPRLLTSDVISTVKEGRYEILCLSDLPPSPPSKTRYLLKKLRAAMPNLRIVVGRWAPTALADDNPRLLLDAGADQVSTRLTETRDHLQQLARLTAPPAPVTSGSPAPS